MCKLWTLNTSSMILRFNQIAVLSRLCMHRCLPCHSRNNGVINAVDAKISSSIRRSRLMTLADITCTIRRNAMHGISIEIENLPAFVSLMFRQWCISTWPQKWHFSRFVWGACKGLCRDQRTMTRTTDIYALHSGRSILQRYYRRSTSHSSLIGYFCRRVDSDLIEHLTVHALNIHKLRHTWAK